MSFVIREKGGPVPFSFGSGPTPHRPRHYTYSIKIVFGHHVARVLEGDPGNSARIFSTKQAAEAQLRQLPRGRWIVLSLETARRDQAEVDAQNVERAERRKRWEAAIVIVAEAERGLLAAVRAEPLRPHLAEAMRLTAADAELAEAAKEAP